MKLNQFLFKFLCFFILLLLSSITYSQCALNAGADDLTLCDTDTDFDLNATPGSQIAIGTIRWSNPNSDLFLFDPTLEDPIVLIDDNLTPSGCYDFIVSAMCTTGGNSGSMVSDTVQICFGPEPTQAVITETNGNDAPAIDTICQDLILYGNTNLVFGETGCWSILENSSSVMIRFNNDINNCFVAGESFGDNVLDVTFINPPRNICATVVFQYTINNGFCTTTDIITIVLTGMPENVSLGLQFEQGFFPFRLESECTDADIEDFPRTLCTDKDTILFIGSGIGCLGGTTNFSVTPPGRIISQSSRNARIELPEDQEYIVSYTAMGGPCGNGTVMDRFVKCSIPEFVDDIEIYYCDSIPTTVTFFNQPDDEWFTTSSSGITDGDIDQSGSTVTINNIPEDANRITIFQCIGSEGCEQCTRLRRIDLRLFPQFEDQSSTLDFLCGTVMNWNPWDQVSVPIAGNNPTVTVLSAPPNSGGIDPGEDFFGTNPSLSLLETGEYKFRLNISQGVCIEELILCVNVCDAGLPSAGSVTELPECEEINIVGVTNDDECADPLWTQISGPPIVFTEGSATDLSPTIEADSLGKIVLEFSISREDDCYLADTICIEVIPCDTLVPPCDLPCPPAMYTCEPDSGGFYLYLDGINQATNPTGPTYYPCNPDLTFIPFGDPILLDSVCVTVCDWSTVDLSDEDPCEDACCWDYKFLLEVCCDGDAPMAEYICDPNSKTFVLHINGESQSGEPSYRVCPEEFQNELPFEYAETTVEIEICEWGNGVSPNCEEPGLCCWTIPVDVPEVCCSGDAPDVYLECHNEFGQFCIVVDGVHPWDPNGQGYLVCGPDGQAPCFIVEDPRTQSEVTFTVCEYGFETECGDRDADCCWEYTIPLKSCCPEKPELDFECIEGEACLTINGVSASKSTEFELVSRDECFSSESIGSEFLLTINSKRFRNCSWNILARVPDCREDCNIELAMTCFRGRSCLFINGAPARKQTGEYNVQGANLCFAPRYAGRSVSYTVTDRENPDCVVPGTFVIRDCSIEDCDIELAMTCYNGSACLFIKGAPANLQTSEYKVIGPALCLGDKDIGSTVTYVVASSENGDCQVTGTFIVADCRKDTEGGTGSSVKSTLDIIDNVTSIEDIKMYPNPALDNLYLSHNIDAVVKYQIINTDGKIVARGDLIRSVETMISLDAFTSGLHIIRLENSKNELIGVKKFIKL